MTPAQFKKKIKNNRKFRIKMYWFNKGQRRCPCCGVQLNWKGGLNGASIEHLVPNSQGGTLNLLNTIIVCSSCNNKRSDSDYIEWVTQNNTPKKEWLIQKYVKAVNFYNSQNVKIKVNKQIIKNLTINIYN